MGRARVTKTSRTYCRARKLHLARDLNVSRITTKRALDELAADHLLHHRLVAERNHARREALIVDATADAHLSESIEPEVRKRMARAFKRIRDDGGLVTPDREQLCADVEASLAERTTRP